MVVIVVKNTLLVRFAPEAIIPGILGLCASQSVCTVDSGDHLPRLVMRLVDVVHKYSLKTVTTLFRVWHQADVPLACFNGGTPILKVLLKHVCESADGISVLQIMASRSTTHNSFCRNDKKVSQRYLFTILAPNLRHLRVE